MAARRARPAEGRIPLYNVIRDTRGLMPVEVDVHPAIAAGPKCYSEIGFAAEMRIDLIRRYAAGP
jgi:hypothetical protein